VLLWRRAERRGEFLARDGGVWTTDKDGPIMNLLAGITARTGKDPGEQYSALTAEFGTAYYTRIDAPATPEQKTKLEGLSPEAVKAPKPIDAELTRAPGNDAPIGSLKVVTRNGWSAARPSGNEAVYRERSVGPTAWSGWQGPKKATVCFSIEGGPHPERVSKD
jgi:phosphoglucomutase